MSDWFTPTRTAPPLDTVELGSWTADDVITAAVGPLRNTTSSSWFGGGKNGAGDVKAKQEAICRYDQNGPGFVGFYLDLYASLAAEFPLIMRKRNADTGEWERWDTGRANALLETVRGVDIDQAEFHEQNCRRYEAVGEVAFWPHPDKPSLGWHSGLPHLIGSDGKHPTIKGRPAVYIVKTDPSADKGDPGYHRIPHDSMRRIWRKDISYPDLPYSPLFRILPDIRRFETLNRGIQRKAAALIIMQGLLWFEGDANDVGGKPDASGKRGRLGGLGSQIESLIQAAKRNSDDVDEKQVAGAFPHPFVYKSAPQHIEFGTPIPAGVLEGKADALQDAARGVSGPMSAIVDGQGAAQRLLNEWRQETAIMRAAAALSARVASSYGQALLHNRLNEDERGNVQVWIDTSVVDDVDTEQSDDLELWKNGVINRAEFARRRKIDTNGLLELPDDVTEYEHFLATQGRTVEPELLADVAAPDVPVQAAAVPWWHDGPVGG